MHSIKQLFLLVTFLLLANGAVGSVYQYHTEVKGMHSLETDASPVAHLWIGDGLKEVRAIMFAMQNMAEETFFENQMFRSEMLRLGVAILWITPPFGWEWRVEDNVETCFFDTLHSLALLSNHKELDRVPLIPFGHSAQATMPWNFAAWNNSRTLCAISFHGDAPRTNLTGYGMANVEWGRERNIDGIPALMVMGEWEWWQARLLPALAFRMMYPKSCVSFLADTGCGHFDASLETMSYVAKFIAKAMELRLDNGVLRSVDPEKGWLLEAWNPTKTSLEVPDEWAKYKGCRHEAFWYGDEEMAHLAYKRCLETINKQVRYISFTQNGRLLDYNAKNHCKLMTSFCPAEAKTDTFHLKAVLVDSLHRKVLSKEEKIDVEFVSGPVKVVNDTTFAVDRNYLSWSNPRRGKSIYLAATLRGNERYKGSVQEIEIRILDN